MSNVLRRILHHCNATRPTTAGRMERSCVYYLLDGTRNNDLMTVPAPSGRFLRSSTVTIIIDGAAFYISVFARASGSEAELCLLPLLLLMEMTLLLVLNVAFVVIFEKLIFWCPFGI